MAELNFNAEDFVPLQPEDKVSDYAVWVELCQRMDREVAQARLDWREAVLERDRITSQLKEKANRLKIRCMELEARQKPSIPKRPKEHE